MPAPRSAPPPATQRPCQRSISRTQMAEHAAGRPCGEGSSRYDSTSLEPPGAVGKTDAVGHLFPVPSSAGGPARRSSGLAGGERRQPGDEEVHRGDRELTPQLLIPPPRDHAAPVRHVVDL